MPRQPSLTASEIARFLRETEIDSDADYDARKREQLAVAFAWRLFPTSASERNMFITDVAREVGQ